MFPACLGCVTKGKTELIERRQDKQVPLNLLFRKDCRLIKLLEQSFYDVLPNLTGEIDLVLTDPVYGDHKAINFILSHSLRLCSGTVILFCYPEDVAHLSVPPDQVCHWIKPTSTKNTSRQYSRFVEAICIWRKEKAYFNQEAYWSNRSGIFTDVLYDKPLHPWQKPEGLVEKLVLNHSKPGQLILDACAGSGTTGLVAERNNRDSVLIENNPEYLEILKARLSL